MRSARGDVSDHVVRGVVFLLDTLALPPMTEDRALYIASASR
jgi:hypothetical protein